MEEKGITNSPNSGAQGRRLLTNPGCFFKAKPSASEEALAGQLDWPRLHSFLPQGVTLATASCQAEVQGVYPHCDGPQPGQDGEKSQNRRPGVAGPAEGEGEQPSSAQRLRGPGRPAGSGDRPARRWAGQPPVPRALGVAWSEDWGSSSPAPGPSTPSGPCPEPGPACSRLAVPEPSWNWLARQPGPGPHRRRRRAR